MVSVTCARGKEEMMRVKQGAQSSAEDPNCRGTEIMKEKVHLDRDTMPICVITTHLCRCDAFRCSLQIPNTSVLRRWNIDLERST